MVAILLRKGAWQRHFDIVPPQRTSINCAVVIQETATVTLFLSFSRAWQRHWYTAPVQGIWQ